jgi:GT2 family glycosyltransferase
MMSVRTPGRALTCPLPGLRAVPSFRQPVVAVPARNEADRLALLLSALSGQTWCGRDQRLPVVLVLNNCTDRSAEVVEAQRGRHPQLDLIVVNVTLEGPAAHVGAARRIAMEGALEGRDAAAVALLTTDADAQPEPGWVDASLAALDAGADLVGGRIIGDPEEEARLGPGFQRRVQRQLRYAELCDRLAALMDPLAHDPLPRHGDHTGASLAVRGEVYQALGGLPPLPFREDVAFVRRARAAGFLLRHCPDVRVRVSARLEGRAPGGMADCLRSWTEAEAAGQTHLVESPDRLLARLSKRRAIRCGVDIGAGAQVLPTMLEELGLSRHGPWAAEARVELWASDDLDAPGETAVEAAIAVLESLLEEANTYVVAA